MALKTAFLFFGTILILLQFCHVSCDAVKDGVIKVDVTSSGSLSFECSQTITNIKDYKCKFQLSNGIFIEYKSQVGRLSENVTTPVKYQIIHPAMKNDTKVCQIEVDAPFDLEKSNRWKCWIVTHDNIFGNYLIKALNTTTEKSKPNMSSSRIFTKAGDMFMAGCQVMHPIDYCYLVSPNGTQYAVTTSEIVPNYPGTSIQLDKYKLNEKNYNKRMYSSKNVVRTLKPSESSNFTMGDCFALIQNAGKSNEGNWTCQLHLTNSTNQIALNFTVNVTESYLKPDHKGSSPKTLSCNAYPTFPSKVVDCRWALPNGTFISEDLWNVKMEKNDTSCMITFNDWKGEWHTQLWTCFVQFENEFGDRFHASDVVSSSTISLPILINIVSLTIFSLLHYAMY